MRKFKKYKLFKRKKYKYKRMTKIKINKNTGFKITPKNNISYDGIEVEQLLILKKKLISNLLKKKVKRKLDLYIDLIVDIADDDSESTDTSFSETLDELSRFKDIIRYKYKKYLDAKYIKLLVNKIELLEYELKEKIMLEYYEIQEENKFENVFDEEIEHSKGRR